MNKVLAKEELDALLSGISTGDVSVETDTDGEYDNIVNFDLTNQDRIIRGRMPVLEIINDRFARLCTSALTNAVRKRVELNSTSIDMTKFGEFMRALPVPSSIHIFKIDPLRGNALIIIDSRLVFAFIENIFGGMGAQPKVEGRDFTRIEQAIVTRLIKSCLESMEEAWRPIHDVKIEIVRSEINPQFATIVPPSDIVIVTTFEVELETSLGSMFLCIPYGSIEPIRSKLLASFQTERLEKDHVWTNRLTDRLMETTVELVVTLGTSTINANQLLRMEVGDVIVLQKDAESLLTCSVEGVTKYEGIGGINKSMRCFQIVNEIEPKMT